jgi:uncharacterized membrane protein (UPF0127 family)/CheY-like chemotaxis protein
MVRTVRIVNMTRGGAVCERAVLADHAPRRMRGLMFRKSLPQGEGMFLLPAPGVHTFFMRFPLDLVFLDRQWRVVRLVEGVKPWRARSLRKARAVLELPAGEIALRGVRMGDQLAFDDGAAVLQEMLLQGRALDGGAPRGPEPSLRVVLLTGDRRFRSMASTLLAQRGCTVAARERAAAALELVGQDDYDVVLVDGGLLLTEAARTVAALEALAPVGVVVVTDDGAADVANLTVLPKWSPFEEIFEALLGAHRKRAYRRAIVEHH